MTIQNAFDRQKQIAQQGGSLGPQGTTPAELYKAASGGQQAGKK